MSLVGGMPVAHLPPPEDFNIVVAEVARNGPEFYARLDRLRAAQEECLKVIDVYKKALSDWGTTEEINRLYAEEKAKLEEAEATLARARIEYNKIVGDARVVAEEAIEKAKAELAEVVRAKEDARTELSRAIVAGNEVRSNANRDAEAARAEAAVLLDRAKEDMKLAAEAKAKATKAAVEADLRLVKITEKLNKINAIAGA